MCRHFALLKQDQSLLSEYDAFDIFDESKEQIFANDTTYAILLEGGRFCLKKMRFGFYVMEKFQLNARKETVHEKPLFAPSFESRRCVIPCSYFFEEDSHHNEHLFQGVHSPLLYLAAIYDKDRFVLLTQKGDDTVSFYHPRMPLCLRKEDFYLYLDLHNKEYLFDSLRSVELSSPDTSEQLSLFSY